MWNEIALIQGKVYPLSEARIPLEDRGFLLGHAIFETLLCVQGRVVGFEEHMTRLNHGCARAFIAPVCEVDLKKDIALGLQTLQKHCGEAFLTQKISLRIVVSAGGSGRTLGVGRSSVGDLPPAHVYLIFRLVAPGVVGDLYEKGIALKSFPDARNKALLDIKCTHYLYSIMAYEEALHAGFDDAIFVNERDELSECTTANFLWWRDGQMYTAPCEGNALGGTTLKRFAQMLAAEGDVLQWKALSYGEKSLVQGALVLSSVRGLVPVRKIDDMTFDVALFRERCMAWRQALE